MGTILVNTSQDNQQYLVKAPWVYNRFIVTRQALIIISKDYWYIKARWVGLINTPEKVIHLYIDTSCWLYP